MAIFTITAPSGAGKTTLVKALQSYKAWSEGVSTTTRKPRDGEVEGVAYYFKSEREFTQIDARHELAEVVEYDGNLYGITKAEIERVQKLSKHIVIIIEYEGYKQIKKLYPDSVNIFIHMSKEDCLANMLLRGDKLEDAMTRIDRYDNEISKRGEFDYVIKNVRGRQTSTESILIGITNQYK
ncbi:guanylate kinase [Priestia aryabhattai]|uniref:guanylate kinase n=1 Tax=Priestia aryabhattai TaxID=412384 RepID=UPI0039A01216